VIPAETIRTAYSADLTATAERLGVQLRTGRANERVGRCPLCGGDDQLRINVKAKVWLCRGCNKGGDVVGLVRHVHRAPFAEAVAFLANEESIHG